MAIYLKTATYTGARTQSAEDPHSSGPLVPHFHPLSSVIFSEPLFPKLNLLIHPDQKETLKNWGTAPFPHPLTYFAVSAAHPPADPNRAFSTSRIATHEKLAGEHLTRFALAIHTRYHQSRMLVPL
jgi:hypothetical protein